MSESSWKSLFKDLKGEPRKCRRCAAVELEAFEKRVRFRLPVTYREFCRVFGPGSLGGFRIAVPGYDGLQPLAELEAFNGRMHTLAPDVGALWSPSEAWRRSDDTITQDRFDRAVFFADDKFRDIFYWDPTEVTDAPSHECTVYVLYFNLETRLVAQSFEEFVDEICLGERQLEFVDRPARFFTPAW